jgi:hemoglobin-like flavoprotein
MSKGKLKPLTKEQILILKKTFRLLDTDQLAKRFYAVLFTRYPEVRSLFTDDMNVQATKLISVFELVIFSFEERKPNQFFLQEQLMTPLRTLGKLHIEKGVANAHYPIANEILLESIKAEAGYVFSAEAEEAWKLALNHLSTAMLCNEIASETKTSPSTLRDSFNYIKSLLFKS